MIASSRAMAKRLLIAVLLVTSAIGTASLCSWEACGPSFLGLGYSLRKHATLSASWDKPGSDMVKALRLRGGSEARAQDEEEEDVELRESEEDRLRHEAEEMLKNEEGVEEFEMQLEQSLMEAAEAEDAEPDSWRELADFLQSKGRDLGFARELYQRCLERDKYNLRANCNLGRLLHEAGEHDAAEEHYLRALKKDADDTDTLNYYGVFLQSVRKVLPAAAAVYKRVLEQRPEDADCHSNYGTLLLEMLGPMGALDAEKHLKKALELQPNNINALYNYAVLLQELRGDWAQAESCLEKVLELDPNDLAATYNYAIMQLEVEDNYDKAEELCKKVLDASPDDVDALYVYGDLLAFKRPEGQRDYETAKHVYERALELDPTHIDVMINYGILRMQGFKDIPGSLALFVRAATIDPRQLVSDAEGKSTTISELCREVRQLMLDLEGQGPEKLAQVLDPTRWVAKGLEGAYHHDTIAKRFEEYKKNEGMRQIAQRYEQYRESEGVKSTTTPTTQQEEDDFAVNGFEEVVLE
mmetsp:Transcript_53258/g.125880  ORF Transcript_53258/g.125880 Transcript_53258/m.125880 type:complete len:527 (-) Transcript_53258:278-1858(-)